MAEKILVADDETHIAEGLQMLLADEGYEVDTATDGNIAWKLAEQGGYGVVLADLRMPRGGRPGAVLAHAQGGNSRRR